MQDMAYAFAEEFALWATIAKGFSMSSKIHFMPARTRLTVRLARRPSGAECLAAWGGIRFVLKMKATE